MPPFILVSLFRVWVWIEKKIFMNGLFFDQVSDKMDGIIMKGVEVFRALMVEVSFVKLRELICRLFNSYNFLFRVFFGELEGMKAYTTANFDDEWFVLFKTWYGRSSWFGDFWPREPSF